jgi:hypothetical protein
VSFIRQGYEIFIDGGMRFGPEIGVHIGRYDESGDLQLATEITFAAWRPDQIVSPAFRLSDERAQSLIDALWAAGLRPTEGRQSEGVTHAQARHLEDMRTIAFGKLGMAVPE